MGFSQTGMSIHGQRLALGEKGNLLRQRPDGGAQGQEVVKTVTSAQVLALFTTPIELVSAPDAGYAHVVRRVTIHKPAGTAYTVGTATSIVVKYTNAAGANASGVVAPAAFADQATAQTRVALGFANDTNPVSAAALVLSQLVANMTAGTSALVVRVEFDTIKLVF